LGLPHPLLLLLLPPPHLPLLPLLQPTRPLCLLLLAD
jgi:hypothetical protein